MSDSEAIVDSSPGRKRRRSNFHDSAQSTPQYSRSPSSDELADEKPSIHHLSRSMQTTSLHGNSGDVCRDERSPSRDELDHTYNDNSRDISRQQSRSPRSRSLAPSDHHGVNGYGVSGMRIRRLKYKEKMILNGHKAPVAQVRFSPDGRWIASCSADATLKVWDAQNGKLLQTMEGHLAGISTLAWSPDSRTIATGSDDKVIRLWNRATGKAYPPLLGHHNYVFSLAFSPKGNMLASGSYDEAVFLWDVRAGRQMRSLPAHSDPVGGVDFVRDGTLIVSCATDGLIRIWDTATGQCLRTLVHEDNRPVVSAQFSPNGKYVLAWTLDGSIRLWDYVDSLCKKTYRGHTNTRFSIGGGFGIYDAGRGGEVKDVFVVSGSEDGKVFLWDINSKDVLQSWQAHNQPIMWVDASSRGSNIVTCSLDGSIKVWVDEEEVGDQTTSSEDKSALEVDVTNLDGIKHYGVGGEDVMDYDTLDDALPSISREEVPS